MSTGTEAGAEPARSVAQAVLRSLRRRCPQCGEGRLFAGYLKTAPQCEACGLDISGHRADDLPPYLTILLVGKLVISGLLAMETAFAPPAWFAYGFWAVATVALCVTILPYVKGAVLGLQYAWRMHGFAEPSGRE